MVHHPVNLLVKKVRVNLNHRKKSLLNRKLQKAVKKNPAKTKIKNQQSLIIIQAVVVAAAPVKVKARKKQNKINNLTNYRKDLVPVPIVKKKKVLKNQEKIL